MFLSIMHYLHQVPLSCGVEQWASQLFSSVHSTLHHHITSPVCSGDSSPLSLEDTVRSQVAQVACMALFFQWCRETEQALIQCRYDRRAIPGARAKFNMWATGKLAMLVVRSMWRGSEEPVTSQQRASLEALAMVCNYPLSHALLNYSFQLSLWLRDVLDDLCHRKMRDINDFEWQRYLRPSFSALLETDKEEDTENESNESTTVVLKCLDQQIEYGFEYLGCVSIPVFTPRANNYMIAFTQVSYNNRQ